MAELKDKLVTLEGLKATIQEHVKVKSVNGQSGAVVLKASDVGAKTSGVVNLLVPISATQTYSGVTCTNNGDGTYTLNGTATANQSFVLHDATLRPLSSYGLKPNTTYKLCGCPKGGNEGSQGGSYKYALRCLGEGGNSRNIFDFGNGATFNFDESATVRFQIQAIAGNTYNNLVFKPMITENLDAVYDDFVPFGSGSPVSNRNLLDNGWFNVNSRGLTSLANYAGYLVDRWNAGNTADYVIGNGIKITQKTVNGFALRQHLPTLKNATYTLSCKVTACSGNWRMFALGTGLTKNINNETGIITMTLTTAPTSIVFWSTAVGDTITIEAVKLEFGNHSTLAFDNPPDLEEEQFRCFTSKADASDTLTGQPVNMGSNPNLLDNPWFTVNQRGNSTYPAGASEYTVDRWKKSAASEVSVLSDGINFKLTSTATSSFSFGVWEVVDISRYVNKTVTMSVLSEGSDQMAARMRFVDASDAFISTEATDYLINGITTKTAVVPSNAARVWVQVGNRLNNSVNATVKIKACKLELGPVSTLSLDHAPDYATELLKCQRYFVKLINFDTRTFLNAVAATTTYVRFSGAFPTTMRATPTMSVVGTINTTSQVSNSICIVTPSSLAITNISNDSSGRKFYSIIFNTSGISVGYTYGIRCGELTQINFSADL